MDYRVKSIKRISIVFNLDIYCDKLLFRTKTDTTIRLLQGR
jgi:hypothetical protein